MSSEKGYKNYFSCFKSYDVRGVLGVNFDASIVYRIGRAMAEHFSAKIIVVGHDARQSSPDLAEALIDGITDQGADVFDLGLSGTEEMYWAVTEFNSCAGITVTASHNPINYNGLKLVKKRSEALDPDSDFKEIRKMALTDKWISKKTKGSAKDVSLIARQAYVRKILSFVNICELKELRILVNSGNGAAGPTFEAIEDQLCKNNAPVKFVKVHHVPDYNFPNGIPNPLLVKNHPPMQKMILEAGADFGIAFDGDFDRCFFFDEKGKFIPGEYIVGILAAIFLDKEPGATIVRDPRVIYNVQDIIEENGGNIVTSKTGHAYIKRAMRAHDAIYGGELSAHHYFRDFAFSDSGMIPWLLILEIVSRSRCSLGSLIESRQAKFPSSGEMNFKVENPDKIIDLVKENYVDKATSCCFADGLSLEFDNWRLNLRKSNTEPLVRLNIESKKGKDLIESKVAEMKELIDSRN